MVLGVCRRVLREPHDAEDAFQATFLVLVRKARSLDRRDSLTNYLYTVAYHLALRARSRAARGPAPARTPEASIRSDPLAELAARELCAVLDEELHRLPAPYRSALLLCCLEGKSRDEAARQLGWSPGALKGRLERGREALRARLRRRGLTLSGVLLADGLSSSASAAVPAGLVDSTARAVIRFAAGSIAEGASTGAILLAEGALRNMAAIKRKVLILLVLMGGLVAAGAGVLARPSPLPRAPERVAEGPTTAGNGQSEPTKATEKAKASSDRYGDALPAGAIARMGTVRLRHNHFIGSLSTAFSPDGKTLTTYAPPGPIRLWDTVTGKSLGRIEVKEGRLGDPLFSPDGRWLAVPEDGSVGRYDVATGRRLGGFPAEGVLPASVSRLAGSPDGKLLAGGSADGSVYLWDVATCAESFRLRGHQRSVHTVAFTPDNRTLVSACFGGQVCRWDVATGTLVKRLEPKLERGPTIRLAEDGKTLAVDLEKSVRLLDSATGEERCTLPGDQARAHGIGFSRDGKTLATVWAEAWSTEGTLALWDAGTGKLVRHFPIPGQAVGTVRFAPDGRTLVTAGHEPLVRLWDTATGRSLLAEPAHEGGVECLAFTPDGRTLVSGARDGTVRLWDPSTGRQQRELAGHSWGANALAVLPDGRAVLSSGTDGLIRLQELAEGKELRRIVLEQPAEERKWMRRPIFALGLSADGRTAASLSNGGMKGGYLVHVWDLATGRALVSRRDESHLGTGDLSPDGKMAVAYASTLPVLPDKGLPRDDSNTTRVVLQDVATGRQLLVLPQPDRSGHLYAFAPDGRTLATATLRVVREGETNRLGSAALRLWELATGKECLTITNDEKEKPAQFERVAFAPDGRTLATARADRVLQLWDVATGKELLRRSGYEAPVGCLTFARDGKTLASGHADGTILTWDTSAATARKQPARKLDAREREACWTDLAGTDARRAHAAVWESIAAPQQAIPLLADRLRPVPAVPADELRQLLADLDSGAFPRREKASERLAALGEQVEPALRDCLQGNPSPEQRRRVEELLAAPREVRAPESLRRLRAIQVLEQIGTADARQVLETLAQGAPAARETREAKASLERLARR
jgi:RNA polymerase sigma factor (sigma-70 family)